MLPFCFIYWKIQSCVPEVVVVDVGAELVGVVLDGVTELVVVVVVVAQIK